MTGTEFKNEFELHYDRMSNQGAPGLEPYEISAILTDAQNRIIKFNYQGKTNRLRKGFEQTEKRRKDISELVEASVSPTNLSLTSISSDQSGAHRNSFFYDLPDNFWLAIEESLLTNVLRCDIVQSVLDASSRTVIGDTYGNRIYTRIKVLPKTHDEYMSNIDNPFVKPKDPNDKGRKATAWRLDFSKAQGAGSKRHEIVTSGSYGILQYYVRYIAKPTPIIVEDLTGYTIDGLSAQTDCVLDDSIHREIVQLAVSIALETVKDNRWQSQKIESMNVE